MSTKPTNWKSVNRKIHYWGSAIIAIPILIVIVTGIILLLKKDIGWIQPPTHKGIGKTPTISFEEIVSIASQVDEAGVTGWHDIDRLDVRPKKGVIKIRTKDSWEIQIDHQTGKLLHTAYRRSDLIESIHDGSFFHDYAKLGLFLPASLILLVLWVTGIYLFALPLLSKKKKKAKQNTVLKNHAVNRNSKTKDRSKLSHAH